MPKIIENTKTYQTPQGGPAEIVAETPDCAGRNGVNEPFIGDIQVCDAREYGRISGFVIEQFSYWSGAEPRWAIPDWEERGLADLAGVFETAAAAHAAIAKAEGR